MELFPTQTSAEENGTARKLEEKNLLGKLEGNSGDDSGVDCTLSLRFPPGSGGRKDMGSSSSSSYSKLVFGYCNANAMHGGGYTKAGHAIRTVNVTPIFVRKCLVCGTTETPLWRNGPHGHKSLCNACGIRFKKVEMKALMNGIVNSPEKPNGGHGKSGQEIRRTTKKPKYQFAPNSTPQL